jgi:hypothetical protein
METGQIESLPEMIECIGRRRGSWPNISGAKLTGTEDEGPYEDGPFELKKYSYTFNNLWSKKVTFCLELIGREFEYIDCWFEIVKITTKK